MTDTLRSGLVTLVIRLWWSSYPRNNSRAEIRGQKLPEGPRCTQLHGPWQPIKGTVLKTEYVAAFKDLHI